ncbi:MAG: glycosyltransferase, partial [Sphingobacteriaceae bacterium]
ISVIIVVYNDALRLEQTLLSIFNQTYKNIELCIIDGGSTDGTIDIIKQYQNKIAFWKSEPDTGIYDAMNKGIKAVKGDWVYFIGAGDILLNLLNKITPLFKNDNCIYYGNVYRNDIGAIFDGNYPSYKLAVQNICHQGIFYPVKALRKYNFNTKYISYADYDLNIRCYGDDNLVFEYMPVLVCIYEGDGYSDLHRLTDPFLGDKPAIIKANFSYPIYIYTKLRTMIAKLVKPGYLKQ